MKDMAGNVGHKIMEGVHVAQEKIMGGVHQVQEKLKDVVGSSSDQNR